MEESKCPFEMLLDPRKFKCIYLSQWELGCMSYTIHSTFHMSVYTFSFFLSYSKIKKTFEINEKEGKRFRDYLYRREEINSFTHYTPMEQEEYFKIFKLRVFKIRWVNKSMYKINPSKHLKNSFFIGIQIGVHS